MPVELGEQAVQVAFRGSTITLALLRTLVQNALDSRHRIEHGEQGLKKLNLQGKQLESVKLTSEDIKEFRQHLNRHAVDFSVMKDKVTGEYSVFFKGQDIDRVYTGLEKTLQTALDRMDAKKPIKEVMEQAKQKSAERAEQQQQKPEKNRSVDRMER